MNLAGPETSELHAPNGRLPEAENTKHMPVNTLVTPVAQLQACPHCQSLFYNAPALRGHIRDAHPPQAQQVGRANGRALQVSQGCLQARHRARSCVPSIWPVFVSLQADSRWEMGSVIELACVTTQGSRFVVHDRWLVHALGKADT